MVAMTDYRAEMECKAKAEYKALSKVAQAKEEEGSTEDYTQDYKGIEIH